MITQNPFPPIPSFPSALGRWTYRSFINHSDISKEFNTLEFGRAELIIEQLAPGSSAEVHRLVTTINFG